MKIYKQIVQLRLVFSRSKQFYRDVNVTEEVTMCIQTDNNETHWLQFINRQRKYYKNVCNVVPRITIFNYIFFQFKLSIFLYYHEWFEQFDVFVVHYLYYHIVIQYYYFRFVLVSIYTQPGYLTHNETYLELK